MWWWVGAVCAVVLVTTYLTWIAARTRRLQARATAAAAALDAQLVRRAAAAAALADVLGDHDGATALRAAAYATLEARPEDREATENALTRRLREIAPDAGDVAFAEVVTAGRRVGVARQVHTDLVRDALRLRRRRLVRLLRFAGGVAAPRYFEIEDTTVDPRPASAPPA